jgi:hypothetical protein
MQIHRLVDDAVAGPKGQLLVGLPLRRGRG